jgi:hypothetical protein
VELRVFWRTLLRRWYLTLVVLALSVGATSYVVTTVGPGYEAEGSALVFPPANSSKTDGETTTVGNPYLELAGVNQARDVVIRTLKSRSVQTQFEEDFPGTSYEAMPDYTNSAPIILFDVEGDSATGTAAALEELMGRVPDILDDLQGGLGLPQDGLVTARKLTQDSRPAVVRKDQIRAGLLVLAASGGIGLLLLALADSLLSARAQAKARRAAARAAEQARREEEEEAARLEAEAQQATATQTLEDSDESRGDEVDEPDPEPVYTYRVPVDSALAVSPARSKWLQSSGTPRASRRPHPEGQGDVNGATDSPQAKDHRPRALITTRSRNVGRNR